MGVTNSNKVISAARTDCDGTLRVTLALTAAPDIVTNPTDIVLVLDRSGSMTGAPLASMKAGATNIVINEVVHPDFLITSILAPNKGTATMLDGHSLRWSIPALGVTDSESAVLEFFIRHTAQTPGTKLVNQSITYSDTEGNAVTFPAPTVNVDCGIVVCPEKCPTPVELSAGGCSDSIVVDMGNVSLSSQGRIIQMDVTIKNVCPKKRVALAAILTEVDRQGAEHQRGVKIMTIPAHDAPACRDVQVKCITFVVPEDLDGSTGCSMCCSRSFRARFLANTIDTDSHCCQCTVTL